MKLDEENERPVPCYLTKKQWHIVKNALETCIDRYQQDAGLKQLMRHIILDIKEVIGPEEKDKK